MEIGKSLVHTGLRRIILLIRELIITKIEFFQEVLKKVLTSALLRAKIYDKFEYHKNDYDEDGRNVKLYRELSGGARQ